jgi:hypothetical protein
LSSFFPSRINSLNFLSLDITPPCHLIVFVTMHWDQSSHCLVQIRTCVIGYNVQIVVKVSFHFALIMCVLFHFVSMLVCISCCFFNCISFMLLCIYGYYLQCKFTNMVNLLHLMWAFDNVSFLPKAFGLYPFKLISMIFNYFCLFILPFCIGICLWTKVSN